MKKLISVFTVLLLLFSSLTISASAEGKIKITEKSFLEYDADDNAYFFAKVENVGDEPIGLGSGKLVGFSDDDDIIVSESYVTSCPSYVLLQPGEFVYVRDSVWESNLKNSDVADYKISFETRERGSELNLIPCETVFNFKGDFDNYIYVTFTNTSNDILYGAYVTVVLYDKEENLIYVDSNSYSSLGIHPESTVTVKQYVDNDMLKYYSTHHVEVEKAQAFVYISPDE